MMLLHKNVEVLTDLPFSQYLNEPGYSHSFLKNQKSGVSPYFESTKKMQLGSLVDSVLTQPEQFDYSHEKAQAALNIASEIKSFFGPAIKQLKCQLSFRATLTDGRFSMNVKGRPDWVLPGIAPLDLKVTYAPDHKSFMNVVRHFGYNNAMFNYCGMTGTKYGYLIPYSVTAKKVLPFVRYDYKPENEFWHEKLMMFGEVVK